MKLLLEPCLGSKGAWQRLKLITGYGGRVAARPGTGRSRAGMEALEVAFKVSRVWEAEGSVAMETRPALLAGRKGPVHCGRDLAVVGWCGFMVL